MKHAFRVRHTLTLALLGIAFLCSCQPLKLRNNSEYRTTADEINLPPGNPTEVLLVLAHPHQAYRAALTEQTLKKFGCEYTINNPALIDRLLATINASHISKRDTNLTSLDLREAIYISYADKPPVNILLRAPFAGELRLPGLMNGTAISVDASIVGRLYEFVAELGVSDECSFFVRKNK